MYAWQVLGESVFNLFSGMDHQKLMQLTAKYYNILTHKKQIKKQQLCAMQIIARKK